MHSTWLNDPHPGGYISLLLHPLDFLSAEDAPELKFFPAMNLPIEKKLGFVSDVLQNLTDNFEVVDMKTHANSVQVEDLTIRTMGEITV